MRNIEFVLDGDENSLSDLFSYYAEIAKSGLTSLEAYIAHAFNLTLARDGFYGAWAEVLKDDKGQYVLTISSPHHDLSVYKDMIPDFLDAGKLGLSIFKQLPPPQGKQVPMQFILPSGLSMAKTRSVQLLHFPPLDALVYHDYLYSPTNRRWENLLGYNNKGHLATQDLEVIVDCVPIAAPGDAMDQIAQYNNSFTAYVKRMLQARMQHHPKIPVMAYGGPVAVWLAANFKDQITVKLEILTLIELQLLEHGPKTQVLCANHPSKYLFAMDDPEVSPEEMKTMMTQDLIAAGWQAGMCEEPDQSPHELMAAMKKYWTDNPKVDAIMRQENEQYRSKLLA